jgi:hypothetical protein
MGQFDLTSNPVNAPGLIVAHLKPAQNDMYLVPVFALTKSGIH